MRRFLAALCLGLGLAATGLSGPARAADLPEPTGPVILVVSGKIGVTNGAGTARFDRAMLEGLGITKIRTSTIWTEGTPTFTGVSLHRLMEAVKADGTNLKAIALNDYTVEIPPEDWQKDAALIAFQRDGKDMSVRDKGPLWIIYPYDSAPRFQSELTYARSIWQLHRLRVE
ncbi:oxidoreductase [Acidimangrovimonas sediminis]|uniref:oxidoreductase n=1 Tax=Acidimangrovimonas sediminis TaxID=2056283 RepID=UPI000C80A346|nr:oxidoreductase [Acidimangrovimonas sediminis]